MAVAAVPSRHPFGFEWEEDKPFYQFHPDLDEMAVPYAPMEVDDTSAAGMESRSAAQRSCTTCSKAKAKCVKQPGHHSCERCNRLNKECHSKEPVLRRKKVVKATRAAQLEKLEGKIEHLVNALSKTQQQRGLSVDHGQPSPPISAVSERSERSSQTRHNELLNAMCDDNPPRSPDATPQSGATTAPATCNSTASIAATADPCALGVSLSEADILLDRYKRLMAVGNPFVIIPPDATAQSLRANKPFLLHAIVTVTYFHDLPQQQNMVKQMMRDVSERILINSEKSIDILQGIIVFVSWYHPHVFWAAQVTNLLHLAMAMTIEMGIDRSPQLCGDFKQSTVKAVHTQPSLTRVPRLEDHRTLAGVYFLTGMLASSFKKIDAMPFTKYLGDALNMLEQACEFESDMFAVQMVRLQHLSEETYTMEAASAPTHMYVRAFNADLERLRKEDPCKNVDNVFLKMQYLTAEILVWELSLIDLLENHAKPLRSHLEDLYHCVEAIKAFIDIFFTIPSSMYLLVPFMTFGQFAHAFIVLVKLASLEVEGWDMKDMHGRLDFGVVIEEAASRFDSAAKSSPDGMVVNNECFGKWAHRMRWMKQVYEGKFSQGGGDSIESTDRGTGTFKTLAGTLKGPGGAKVSVLRQNDDEMPAPADTAAGGVQQATPPDDVLSGDFFNYLDEGFWQSFGTDLDLGFDNMPIGQGVTPAVQL